MSTLKVILLSITISTVAPLSIAAQQVQVCQQKSVSQQQKSKLEMLAKEEKRWVGKWKITMRKSDGVVDQEEIGRVLNMKAQHVGLRKLDPSKSPKQYYFKIVFEGGMTRTVTRVYGIYKIEGDVLTWCEAYGDESQRPTDFSAEKGSGRTLVRLKRIKQ